MSARRFPRVEDLILPKVLQAIGEAENTHQALRSDEVSSTAGLHPVLRGMFDQKAGPQITFGVMARTSVLFVVDHDEYAYAVASARGAPLLPDLPPLPYPRIAVECAEDAVWPMGTDDGELVWELEVFSINEQKRGEEWNVILLQRRYGTYSDPEMSLMVFTLRSDGSLTFWNPRESVAAGLPKPWEIKTRGELQEALDQVGELNGLMEEVRLEPDDPVAASLRSIPIEFAHLINARGVTVEQIPVARQQRRRFERKRLVHPKVYFVLIGEASEDTQGHGDREYHCRWLVRGHWRRYEDGRKTWVRPYIKGPAGAPWKGRPVYITAAAVEAATA